MTYFTLAIACVLFSLQFLFYKKYQLHAGGSLRNALWMVLLDGVWVFIIFFPMNGFTISTNSTAFIYACLFALTAVMCSICSISAFSRGNMSVVTLFMLSGGLIIPVGYGVFWLNETLSLWQTVGIVLIFLSFFPGTLAMVKQKAKKDSTGKKGFLPLCIATFVCNGLIGVVAKAHAISPNSISERDFLIQAALLRFGIAFLLILILAARAREKKNANIWIDGIGLTPKAILYAVAIVLGYTVCNGTANVFSLMTARTMNSSLQFPILSATILLFTAILSRVVFKEKQTKGDLAGLVLTFAGMALMTL